MRSGVTFFCAGGRPMPRNAGDALPLPPKDDAAEAEPEDAVMTIRAAAMPAKATVIPRRQAATRARIPFLKSGVFDGSKMA